MTEREQLEQAIATLESQRVLLGDVVVNAALAPMRDKLAALLAASAPPPPKEAQQRKQVTVLFADVSGFTAMSETMDAEEVSTTMNALWTKLDGAILNQGGRIDKHIGDAVMALFGAPVAREDDPERAIRAALAMQAEIRTLMLDADGEPRLRMRIGINTGPVLLGSVGTTGEYTAMGDTVNLASRLEHAAPVGGILVSHDVYRHVRGVFDVQALEPITVKGKVEPIQVYVVRAAKPKTFRVTTRGVEGLETRTIGREAELRAMQAAYETARDQHQTHLVSVVAEAGTGKSRLLYEFNNWLELRPHLTRLFRGRATLEMSQIPYALIRDVLASRFEILDNDRASVAREKLERGITELVSALGEEATLWAHFVGHLIGFDFSASPYLQGILGDAKQIRDRAFYYFTQFLAALSADNPIAILLEDIHWADAASLDLVNHLLQTQPNLPVLVIGLTRPVFFEQRPDWGRGPSAHVRLDLRPLSEADSRRLVAEILRNVRDLPPQLVDLVTSRAEGSPFYIEELIKMLIEDGVIVRAEEVWRVELEHLAAARIPATLTGILQARLDGLPATEREALQQASVVGRVFWGNVVERMHHPDDATAARAPAVGERLGALRGKELIFPREDSAFTGTEEFIFKHVILHEVTYESVLKRLRRDYHAQVAASLIELSGERANEYAGRIGEHYEKAGEWASAAEWLARAGQQAQQAYAPEAAIAYYRKALDFWKQAGELPAAQVEPHFRASLGLGDMLVARARYTEAIDVYTAMRAMAETLHNPLMSVRACWGLAMAYVSLGDQRTALEQATQAETLARALDARIDLARALWVKGLSLWRLGEAEEAITLGEQTLALADEVQDKRQAARSLNLLGAVSNMLGRYRQAEQHFAHALENFELMDDRTGAMSTLNNLGVIAEARGDYPRATQQYLQALNIARKIGHREGELAYLSNLGAARVGIGDYATAETDLRRAIELAGTTSAWILPDTYRYLAEACVGLGNLVAAVEHGRHALHLAQEARSPEGIGATWRVLGLIAACAPEPFVIDHEPGQSQAYTAAQCFAESLRICTENNMDGERARTLRAWANYERLQGNVDQSQAMWQEARRLFAQLGADLEVERMDAEPQIH